MGNPYSEDQCPCPTWIVNATYTARCPAGSIGGNPSITPNPDATPHNLQLVSAIWGHGAQTRFYSLFWFESGGAGPLLIQERDMFGGAIIAEVTIAGSETVTFSLNGITMTISGFAGFRGFEFSATSGNEATATRQARSQISEEHARLEALCLAKRDAEAALKCKWFAYEAAVGHCGHQAIVRGESFISLADAHVQALSAAQSAATDWCYAYAPYGT